MSNVTGLLTSAWIAVHLRPQSHRPAPSPAATLKCQSQENPHTAGFRQPPEIQPQRPLAAQSAFDFAMAFRAAKLLLASLCAAEASKEIYEALATDEVCSSGQCSLELLQVHGCAGKEATSDCSDTCTQTVWKACMERRPLMIAPLGVAKNSINAWTIAPASHVADNPAAAGASAPKCTPSARRKIGL